MLASTHFLCTGIGIYVLGFLDFFIIIIIVIYKSYSIFVLLLLSAVAIVFLISYYIVKQINCVK